MEYCCAALYRSGKRDGSWRCPDLPHLNPAHARLMSSQFTVRKSDTKAFVKNCDIDLDNWKNIAADRSACRSQVSISIANIEQTRKEKTAWRRSVRKGQVMFPPPSDQPAFFLAVHRPPTAFQGWQMTTQPPLERWKNDDMTLLVVAIRCYIISVSVAWWSLTLFHVLTFCYLVFWSVINALLSLFSVSGICCDMLMTRSQHIACFEANVSSVSIDFKSFLPCSFSNYAVFIMWPRQRNARCRVYSNMLYLRSSAQHIRLH